MNKINLIITAILLALASCSDNSIFDTPTGAPLISKMESNLSFPTDTIRLYGQFIPPASNQNFLILQDSIAISSSDCLKWTTTSIEYIVPDTLQSGKVFCIFGKDTSEKFDLTILRRMPFQAVAIPAGEFTMGSILGLDDETPHRVTISKNLLVAETELSQRLFDFVMKFNPSTQQFPSLPAYNIEWLDAIKFCNALSAMDSLSPAYKITGEIVEYNEDSLGWRLPTEAEWEYIARGNSDKEFIGDTLDNYAWYLNNSGANAHNIAKLRANSFGLYDVLGNVREWCWDYYSAGYYQLQENEDPLGPASGTRRVARGGSFVEGKSYQRVSARKLQQSNVPTGIRLVRTVK